MSRLPRVVVSLVVSVALAGCGMGPQPSPVAIDVRVPAAPDAASVPDGPYSVGVFLLHGDRLHEVRRAAPSRSITTAVELLTVGPSDRESRAGLRTAVAPGSVTVVGVDPITDLVVVGVTADFVATTGTNQLLAVAQVVWTATESPAVQLVRLTRDGDLIDVPTDEGLTQGPVGRADFRTVAPRPERADDVIPRVQCRIAVPCVM
ncbi:GerMN domain-containing protein [uncultured Cellulomonas sp.]|uniref:GerMN domain-containing protein n=1 Tax=uncultured Cellulomonas sp. TaxID=189682 RepID=UPI00262F8065|nr:GerMN domain-containing protein [uncultured Cellulomonas sp.]